jgi:hypothetical protein
VETKIPAGDLSLWEMGWEMWMGKKCPPQTFVGIPAEKNRRGDGRGGIPRAGIPRSLVRLSQVIAGFVT